MVYDHSFYGLLDSLENEEARNIISEIFVKDNGTADLGQDEIIEKISIILELGVNKEDAIVIHDIFKEYDKTHYWNFEYGFLIMLSLTSLSRAKITSVGYVYLCKSDINLFKIGASKNPEQRVKSLGLGSSIKHELLVSIPTESMFKLEKELHKKFSTKREHSEWFNLSEDDIKYIKGLV